MLRFLICLSALYSFASMSVFAEETPEFKEEVLQRLSDEEAASILKLAAERQKAAFEGIETWEGTAVLERNYNSGKSIFDSKPKTDAGLEKYRPWSFRLQKEKRISKATFKVDAKNNLLYSSFKSTAFQTRMKEQSTFSQTNKNEERQWNLRIADMGFVKTFHDVVPEDLYFIHPSDLVTRKPVIVERPVKKIAEISPKKGADLRITDPFFDPFAVFYSGGWRVDTFSARFLLSSKNTTIKGVTKIYQSKDGRYVFLEKYYRGSNGIETPFRFILDSKYNYLPIDKKTDSKDQNAYHHQWRYEKIENAVVPKSYALIVRNKDGFVTRIEKCHFETKSVNKEIASDVFDLVKFKSDNCGRELKSSETKQ